MPQSLEKLWSIKHSKQFEMHSSSIKKYDPKVPSSQCATFKMIETRVPPDAFARLSLSKKADITTVQACHNLS